MGCGLGHKPGLASSQTEEDGHGATTDQPRLYLGSPQDSSSQRHAFSSKHFRHREDFASGSRPTQHTATKPTSNKSCRRSALRSKLQEGALPAQFKKPEGSFFGRFFDFIKSHVTKVNDKIFQLSAKQSRAKPSMAMHQSPSQASIVRQTATCPPSSAGSINDSVHKHGSHLGLSEQVPVIVEDGLLAPREAPAHNAPYSTIKQPSYEQGEETPLHDKSRFSARELRDIDGGSLSMEVTAFDGPQPEIFRFQGEGERVKTSGGTSQIRSSLPIYAAPECRPTASNPRTSRYLELCAMPGWSQRGAISIGLSVSDCDEDSGSSSSRLAIQEDNGSLYYDNNLLGELSMSPFTTGSIGLGLHFLYNHEASTATTPIIDVQIFHTRQGQLIENVRLERNIVGFDGHRDIFVDLQTVDKVEFEVVFKRDWCVYKPVEQV